MASARSCIVPESSETPSKPENYVIVSSRSGEAYRMVRTCTLATGAAAACRRCLPPPTLHLC